MKRSREEILARINALEDGLTILRRELRQLDDEQAAEWRRFRDEALATVERLAEGRRLLNSYQPQTCPGWNDIFSSPLQRGQYPLTGSGS